MEVLAIQLDIAWEDQPANYAKVRQLLEAARPQPGALVVLPEMFATGFSMNLPAVAEGVARPTEHFLSQLARDFGVFTLGGLVHLGEGGKGRNQAVAYSPDGSELARYTKIHPFSFGAESRHYTGGDAVVTFPWHAATVAPFICYDLRFPEVFRTAVRRGAHLYPVIANWPAPREAHWLALLRARAIENQGYVLGVNRCGRDPHLAYSGHSQLIDPRGEILAGAGSAQSVLRASLDLPALLTYRRDFPALSDLRPDFVQG